MDSNLSQGLHQPRTKHSDNIISMRLDAAFFHERGVRFLERNDLHRALRAFRKTVEYEPENPVNHCNLAGVLSELGDFQASNDVLNHILGDLDPKMAECQFYLANNYANMGDYETAEECVLRYLDADPDGEYAQDAEDMLEVLLDECGGGKVYAEWEERRKERERAAARRDGRHFLEEGQFEAAVEWLQQVVLREPGNMAARNNLSLAYYYTAQYDQAVSLTESVLASQPDNIHALCNLAVFSAELGPKERLTTCTAKLLKVFPLHYDQAMKVGTTLGLIGEHEGALAVFQHLLRIVERPEPILLHSVAASAANTGRFLLAEKWWKVLSQLPEMAEVARYYLEQLQTAASEGKKTLRISYQYDLPLHVQFAEMKQRLRTGDLSLWRKDPLLRASLYWGLRHGTADTRRAVIRTLALLADRDAEKALRLFLKRSDLEAPLQAAALYALQRTGAHGRIEIWRDGCLDSMRMSDLPKDFVFAIDPMWKAVHDRSEEWLRAERKTRFANEVKRLWITFVRDAFLRENLKIMKPEVWSAGLVYLVLKHHESSTRQREVAQSFQVSVSALSRAAARLQSVY